MSVLTYSQLRDQKRLDLCDSIPLSMPLSLYIDPSSQCNYRCIYCPQSKDSNEVKPSKMTLEDFAKIIQDIKAMNDGQGKVKSCNLFSFGEPLLNKLTPKFLKLAVENDISEKYIITTNASLLDPITAQKLVDYGLTFLRVSIYGATNETYRERTKTQIDLEKIKENLSYLLEYRNKANSTLSIAVKMLDTSDKEENELFIKTFSSFADECFIEPLHNWHDEQQNFADMEKANERKVCPYPFYTLVIHADLDVSVCCPDWNKKTLIGSLKNESLEEIWKGKKLYVLQKSLLEKDYSQYAQCKHCTFYKFSAGDTIDTLTVEEFDKRLASQE